MRLGGFYQVGQWWRTRATSDPVSPCAFLPSPPGIRSSTQANLTPLPPPPGPPGSPGRSRWRRALIRQQRGNLLLCRGEPVESLPAIGAYPEFGAGCAMLLGDDMDGRRVVQRLVNGETALEIARSFGYRSATPVMDAARDFIVAKLGADRYSAF